MSANPLPKRLLSLVLTLCMVLSLVPMSALAAEASNNPNKADNAIINGSFEDPARTDKNAPQLDDVPGWSTTATDQLIEFGVNTQTDSAPQLLGNDKSIPDGNQFAELNANQVSTLYQNVSTVDGHIYEWGLSHRGRAGTDTMALIIGPKQDNAPAKPGKDGQDQFMRLTDWVKRNAQTLGVTVPTDGCSQRITVYSKKFDKNGGFLNNPGSESPFSTAPSNLYTETWSVWIIATSYQSWGSYGTHNRNYNPLKGIGGGIGCSYTVPAGQTETTFAFCSYSSSGSGGLTVGNLLDNITFSLYHNVTFTTTAGGKGTVSAEIQGTTQTVDFSDKNAIDVPVRNNREMTLTAPATAASGATFVGAYITKHSTDGSSTEFVDKSEWRKNGTTYTYIGPVTAPTDVVLVFVQSPAVTYDANGGDRYVHTPGAQEPTDVVSFAADTKRTEYTSQAATASKKKGWVFDGWLLARAEDGERVLPAKHTVSYANGVFTFTYKNGTETKETKITANGVALLAQWRWQQTFQTQLQQGDTVTDNDACGTITKDNSDDSVKTYNAATGEQVTVTAKANSGYAFLGWYRTIDGQLQLVSQDPTYAYNVGRQGVQTVYARFARTYTITYAWDASNSPTDQTIPKAGTATAGTTYPLPQTFVRGQTTCPGSQNNIPGNWVFQGWKKDGKGEVLGAEIAHVQENMHLVGSWDFIPNAQYDLSYSMGDTKHCWIPSGGLGSIPPSRHYAEETVTSAAAPTIPAEQNTILAAKGTIFQGTWTFQGWKRSDTGETVSAENSAEKNFSMPNQDLTLTAQWKFTPNVYTVQYDLNGGTGVPPAGHDSYTYPEIKGKTGVDTSKFGIPFGASLTVQNFTGAAPGGQYFAGWGLKPGGPVAYEPGENVSNANLHVTEDDTTVTLYAIYAKKQTITVEFQGNNPQWGAVTNQSGSFTVTDSVAGGDVTSTAEPSPGYHFVEWTKGGERVSTDQTLTVRSSDFTEGQAGHTFVYVAHFEPNRFTVQFDQNTTDTVQGSMDKQTFQYADQYAEAGDAYLNPNAFVRPGYRFLGWSETSGKQGVVYADQAKFQGVTYYKGTEIKNNDIITLYAQWEKLLDITIDYTPFPEDLGKVTLNSPQEEEPSEEDLVPHSIYTVSEKGSPDHQVHTFQGATAQPKDGCTFKGWYDQQENQCSKDLSFVPKAGTDNLYQSGSYVAVFEAQQYTLHFDANGGEGTMGDLTYTHGQDQSLTKCGFTRAGYDFLGWATAENGNVAYHDQQSLSITQDTTLYAVWKQQPNQGGSGGGHHNSGGTQEKPDETPPTTLNDTDHYAYIVGYEDGTIRPNGHITRAEAATVFFRLLTDKARDANLTDRSPYPDVSAGAWYNKAIATLSRMGILSGYEDGSFRPNATVTRAEFAAMAARFDTEAKPVDTPFTDLTGCWAADEIAKAYGKGWVNGYGDNTFRPNGPITRAEAVTLINRVLRRLPETDKDLLPDERTWPDNPETFWGYLALQEASNSHLYDRKSDGYETQTKILPPRDWSQEFEQ